MRQRCERLFIDWEVLQVENVCAVYEHAAATNCGQLRGACIQYIRDMFDAVSLTEEYGALPESMREPIVELRRLR